MAGIYSHSPSTVLLTYLLKGFIAKKLCPHLIFVRSRFSRYMELSNNVMEVLRRYDPNMAPAGCDECYLKCVLFETLGPCSMS